MFHCADREGGSSVRLDGSGLSGGRTPFHAGAEGPGRSRDRAAVRVRGRALATMHRSGPRRGVFVAASTTRTTPDGARRSPLPGHCRPCSARLSSFAMRAARWQLCTLSCVERLAMSAGTDVAVLLGRVAAHELGHLIMLTPAHARRGLMRPNWTPYEVRRNRLADWEFTAEDVTAMRQPAAPY